MGKDSPLSRILSLTDPCVRTGEHHTTNEDDDLKEYDLDNYDSESDHEIDTQDLERTAIFGNIKGLAYHENNDDDPYITLKGDADAGLSDEDEREELEILPTDNLVLTARVEDEVAHLECYVYEDDVDNLYVHHDVMLPATPLCLEWLDLPVGKDGTNAESRGNFVAVGTMEPDIELWDLDAVDGMYPNAILGAGSQPAPEKPTKKKKRKSKKSHEEYHVDAVLSLAANRQHRNLLASASADETVKLWDLNTAKCAKSYSYHSDKVCSLSWNPTESTAMLSGSYDKTVIAADMRAPEAGTRRWRVDSDVEKVAWDPHDSEKFFVSTESGLLYYFDARQSSTFDKTANALWRLQAHGAALTSFSVNSHVKGLFATGSDDKTVKLWNATSASAQGSKGPSLVTSRELDVGKIFSVAFAPDEQVAYRLAVGGSKGVLNVWDISTNNAVRKSFAAGLPPSKSGAGDAVAGVNGGGNMKERIISIGEPNSDDETDESDEDNANDHSDNDDEEMADQD